MVARTHRKTVHLTSGHWVNDARVFYKECKSLAGAGFETVIIVPHDHDDFVEGVQVRAVRKARGRLLRVTLLPVRLYRAALREPADCYHIHDPELLPVGLLLKAHGKVVIYDAHEDLPRTFLFKPYLKKWLRRPVMWLAERFENCVARRLDAVIAATPVIGNRLEMVNSNTEVVSNYPRAEELVPHTACPWGTRQNWVVYLGSITLERGAREMVDTMHLLSAQFGARLKIAGIFHDASLRDDLARLPGWSQVDWLGYLNRQQLAALLANAKVGVVVLHRERAYMEAQPVKLYEYMAAGLPVIASDFPAWRPVVDGCGLLVPPQSPTALAEAVTYLLTHPDEAEQMGNTGRLKVQRLYNWSNEEQKLLRLYDSILLTCPHKIQPMKTGVLT